MRRHVSQRAASWWSGALAVSCAALVGAPADSFAAYTTKSPEVVRMVTRATDFLKGSSHGKPGGWALIGLALLKNKEPLNNPKMVEAAEAIAGAVRENTTGMDIYSAGLSIIYLASYDPDRYRSEIETLLKSLETKQKPHGGWGYPDLKTGDTSMTQYGVLSHWEARQAGFTISQPVVDRVATWLLKTQDPSGGHGYQAVVSETGQLAPQQEVRHSLTAAGLGSIYICADLLGLTPEASKSGGRLAAVKEVADTETPKSGPRKRVATTVNIEMLRAAEDRGNGWMQKNYVINPPVEPYYYMYALERYQSFRDLSEGKADRDPAVVPGPQWYTDGVEFLRKKQKADGSFEQAGQCDSVVNTAFAALFLLRSTQKSIRRSRGFGDGMMIGGVGLPKEGEQFLGANGQLVTKTLLGPYAAMEAALSRNNTEDLASVVEQWEQTPGKGSELLTTEHQKRFRALLGDPAPENRVAAVKLLVMSGNLDNVPMLILALDDADPDVVLAARDGLCRLTRRFNGFGPPDNPTPEDRKLAIEKWKAWYLSIRPDTEF